MIADKLYSNSGLVLTEGRRCGISTPVLRAGFCGVPMSVLPMSFRKTARCWTDREDGLPQEDGKVSGMTVSLLRLSDPVLRHAQRCVRTFFCFGALLSVIAVRVPAQAQVTTLPMRIVNDIAIVDVRVNGDGPYAFILDTGFAQDVVDVSTAQRAGLELLDVGVEIRGQGRSTPKALFARNVRLSVSDDVSWSGQLMAVPLYHLESPLGAHVDGILGSAIFSKHVVEIDYRASVVNLWEVDAYAALPNAVTFPIELYGSRPHVDVQLERHDQPPLKARLMIDTGANVGVALSSMFAEWRPETSSNGGKRAAEGIGGTIRFRAKSEADVVLGALRLFDVEVTFSADALENGTGTPINGLLGARVFRGLSLTLDYEGKRAYVSRVGSEVPVKE